MARELSGCELIERSIIKKYRKTIWNPFTAAIKKYQLIQENDKIAVCISGGKDSMLTAKLMQQLHKHTEIPFELEFIVMDPGYNKLNRQKIESNCKLLNIPVKIYDSDIFDVANKTEKNPCYLCARMRRGHLYSYAKQLGCNKIALGHHMSDVIETTLMSMMYGSQIQGMLPRLKSTNFEGMELIRPLYCILERDVISWMNYNNLEFIQCACKMTENTSLEQSDSSDHISTSKRKETKAIIENLRKINPQIELNLFNSIHKVQLDTMVGYKSSGELHSFLEKL